MPRSPLNQILFEDYCSGDAIHIPVAEDADFFVLVTRLEDGVDKISMSLNKNGFWR